MDFGCKGEELVEVKVKVVNTKRPSILLSQLLFSFISVIKCDKCAWKAPRRLHWKQIYSSPHHKLPGSDMLYVFTPFSFLPSFSISSPLFNRCFIRYSRCLSGRQLGPYTLILHGAILRPQDFPTRYASTVLIREPAIILPFRDTHIIDMHVSP